MDEPRRSPPPYPPLALRQRGNAISVRQKPDQDAGWGTLRHPKPLELPHLGTAHLQTRLGYEAEPSTEVWSFTAAADLRLQVTRRSKDRYANCVAVALVSHDNRPVAPLVATAGGIGAPQTVPAGDYKLVVSLGVAEQVQVELELNTSPARTLRAATSLHIGAVGRLLAWPLLSGRSWIGMGGRAVLLQRPLLRGAMAVVAGGRATLLRGGLPAIARLQVGGQALLRSGTVTPLRGRASAFAIAQVRLAPVVVTPDPSHFWRARVVAGQLEVNSAYFRLDDIALARQQLQEAGL